MIDELILFTRDMLSRLIADASDQARMRFLEFFTPCAVRCSPWASWLTIAGFGPAAMRGIGRGAGGSLSGLGDCGRV